MRTKIVLGLVPLILVLAVPARAQVEDTAGSWPQGGRKLADYVSWGTLGAEGVWDTVHNWQRPDRWHALGCEAAKVGLVVGVSEVLKRVVHEERPDGSDNLSWPSEHSGLSAAFAKFNFSISIPLAFGTDYGRLAANKHHWYDVLSGVGIGVAANFICGRGEGY